MGSLPVGHGRTANRGTDELMNSFGRTFARNGFATVLYLRLIDFPFTPMNFGMGLINVRFSDYFFGTGLGVVVGTFIFIFFIGALRSKAESRPPGCRKRDGQRLNRCRVTP